MRYWIWRKVNPLLDKSINKVNAFLEKLLGIRVTQAKGTFDQARTFLLNSIGIDTVIDGGANEGQWALRNLSQLPSDCKLFSFEPNKKSFIALELRAQKYKFWTCLNVGLGDKAGVFPIFVASNREMSSSFLAPGGHLDNFPTVSFSQSDEASIVRLDELNELSQSLGIYLKLDVQGFEKFAYEGCFGILDKIRVIEIETSLQTMYQGDSPHYELIPRLIKDGYLPYAFSTPAKDANGRCTYLDVLLVKE
jgi:FkbM family methyltransferase